MRRRRMGGSGLAVSRLGLGTMLWGGVLDEDGCRDLLVAYLEAGGTLLDTAHSYAEGRSEELVGSPAARGGPARRRHDLHQGRHHPHSRGAGRRHLARRTAASPRRLATSSRHRLRRPVARPHLERQRTPRGDRRSARVCGDVRSGALRRGVELLGLADGPRILAAGGGASSVGGQRDRVLPRDAGRRGRSGPRRRGSGVRTAPLLPVGRRRADRKVPVRCPERLPRGDAAVPGLRARPSRRPLDERRRGGVHRGGWPRRVGDRGGAGLGARPARRRRTDRRMPDRRPAAHRPWPARTSSCRPEIVAALDEVSD